MDITIHPHLLSGTVKAIPSKSVAHRLLICAALADCETMIECPEINQDIDATADCLRALGAGVTRTESGYRVSPISNAPKSAELYCKESGSTLRFMLPIVGALGVDATFHMEGRLPHRPLSPLSEELEKHGCALCRSTPDTIRCTGKLKPGAYCIDGSVSSQYVTGLMFAVALLGNASSLMVTGKTESKPYIEMTQRALTLFDASRYPFRSPGQVRVEGDWSNAAFFLAAKTLGNTVDVCGLLDNSVQGDRAIFEILNNIQNIDTIDAADIPDLVPILAVTAGVQKKITFTNIARLRLKESDRVASVAAMLEQLGAQVIVNENTMTVFPGEFHGCTIDSVGDHRIAMAAAIAATRASGAVTILNAQCVAKSYPTFWEEYRRLGGNYEQHIR
ncbi:MAG: 3-phosphoshikimate 1-carboxyvinyltransferase [Oscillospiraceae bacterium]|nr:3-phosphoshikimate 1-carboxyvinyltransferase [Oscillospiraceae bacterium]